MAPITTPPAAAALLVCADRSGLREAWHHGSVAVVDANGDLLASVGDPLLTTFARSASKPLSGSVCYLLAEEPLSAPEIAITCASHNGESVHIEAVRKLLARANLDFSALRCPPDVPYDPETAIPITQPRPELHNCSGKHAGMLVASARQGYDLETYPQPTHPLQRQILAYLTDVVGSAPEAIGVDGCGVPVHGYPLSKLAKLFVRLVQPHLLGELASAAEQAVNAMRSEPYLVAGRKRVCTALMRSVPGAIAKIGGEGLICIGLRDQGLGIAIKIHDGSMRALGPAAVRVLQLLEIIGPVPEELAEHEAPSLMGGGKPVGRLVAAFDSLTYV